MTSTTPRSLARTARLAVSLTASGLALSGCMVGPNYVRPSAPISTTFKEADGWVQAQPSDAYDRGKWWEVFGDPVLNDLESRVMVSNQTLIQAEAAYRESVALLNEQSASLWPTVDLTGSATRTKTGLGGSVATAGAGTTTTTTSLGGSNGVTANSYSVKIGATWDVDVWGGIRRAIESARATAQASKADIANAQLSAQIALAADYVQLRAADEEKRLIDATVKGYAEDLRIVQNRYAVGTAARTDVLTAQSALKSAQASAVDLVKSRAQYEHAIAVLVGVPPAQLTLELKPFTLAVPAVPVSLPSTLLQRRPDIAAAERTMAAANAQIGVNVAGYFPSLSLTGSDGYASSAITRLFTAAANSWSIGANLAQTVFDAGLTRQKVKAAKAVYDQDVASYRQTVLNAFQQVEDNIAALRVLQAEYDLDAAASDEADENERLTNNEYQAGTVDYTTVIVAQQTALADRKASITVASERLVAAVDLISALGGYWQPDLKVKVNPLPGIL